MATIECDIELNVGGMHYTTSRETLTRYSKSKLATMFSQEHIPLSQDSSGRFTVDRDGPTFRYVLNFLRGGYLNLPRGFTDYDQLMEEVDFYQLDDMKELLQLKIKATQEPGPNAKWCTPDLDREIVEVEGGELFTVPKEIASTEDSNSLLKKLGRYRRSGTDQFDCDPTIFRYLSNFFAASPQKEKEKFDYIPRSQGELKKLREVAQKYNFPELKNALDTNIHLMPPQTG